MPPLRLVLFGKPELRQRSKRFRCFDEIKLRLYRDFWLGGFAISERNQTGCLRFGQSKASSFEWHVGPLDSVGPSMRHWAQTRGGWFGSYPQSERGPSPLIQVGTDKNAAVESPRPFSQRESPLLAHRVISLRRKFCPLSDNSGQR